MNFIALLLTLLVGLFILLGSVIGIYYKNNTKATDFSIAMAFGVIICLIFFEILPETYEALTEEMGIVRIIATIIILCSIGIVFLKLLDLFIPHHLHEEHHTHKHKDEKCHNNHLFHIGVMSTVAIISHNIIEGMSLYLICKHSLISGILMFIGVGLHNVPMGLVIVSTLSSANYSKKNVLRISLATSLSTFFGGLIMLLLGTVSGKAEGILLGLTLGMLIYISVFELAHQIIHMKNKKIAISGILTGIFLLAISFILEIIIH